MTNKKSISIYESKCRLCGKKLQHVHTNTKYCEKCRKKVNQGNCKKWNYQNNCGICGRLCTGKYCISCSNSNWKALRKKTDTANRSCKICNKKLFGVHPNTKYCEICNDFINKRKKLESTKTPCVECGKLSHGRRCRECYRKAKRNHLSVSRNNIRYRQRQKTPPEPEFETVIHVENHSSAR